MQVLPYPTNRTYLGCFDFNFLLTKSILLQDDQQAGPSNVGLDVNTFSEDQINRKNDTDNPLVNNECAMSDILPDAEVIENPCYLEKEVFFVLFILKKTYQRQTLKHLSYLQTTLLTNVKLFQKFVND